MISKALPANPKKTVPAAQAGVNQLTQDLSGRFPGRAAQMHELGPNFASKILLCIQVSTAEDLKSIG